MRLKVILFVVVNILFFKSIFATESDWNSKMQEFRALLSELLPKVISDEEFNSRTNFEIIKADAKKLAMLAHSMPKGELPSDMEASIGLISALFKDEILLAQYHLQSGNWIYARGVLRAIPKYCIACHTRSAVPFDLGSAEQDIPNGLTTSLERAEYFDATWQFDRALDEFEKIVSNSSIAREQQLDWQRAAKYGIAIAVRVKQDPDRALRIVNLVTNSRFAPEFLKKDATKWEVSLQVWKKEDTSKDESEMKLMSEAKRLIENARSMQKYSLDRDADILYLRATSILHTFLTKHSDSPNTGEALLLLGQCYEILQDLDVWSLHELYFEACVRKFPHSPIAQACYNRYELSTFSGYSGSGGTSIPPKIQLHLASLKQLADPL